MSDDDDIPELEDFSQELEKIRQQRGDNNRSEPEEIKVNVVGENKPKKQTPKEPIKETKPINEPPKVQTQPQPQPQTKKDDLDDFGKGFKRGFFRKQNQQSKPQPKPQPKPQAPQQQQPPKQQVEDLTHIKSDKEKQNKKIVESFNKDLKSAQEQSQSNMGGLLNNIVNKKNEWLNQELLTKIAQNPNLMRYFMDPRFSGVFQELQSNPQECMRKYGHIPEFATFIKEFSALMGEHFNNLAMNVPGSNPNMSNPEVQAILNDPKISPILMRLQKEGKIDVDELNRDPYVASKIKVLIDKKILNIQKMD